MTAGLLDRPSSSRLLDAGGRRVVYLLAASSALERKVLTDWIAAHPLPGAAGSETIMLPFSRTRRIGKRVDPRLASSLGSDVLLQPLRVTWLPVEKDGERVIRFYDLVTLGNPRAPSRLRQEWILRRHPERCRVAVAEPATRDALRERFAKSGGDASKIDAFVEFVARAGVLSLERADRNLLGSRYKVPRFVHEEILARKDFNEGLLETAKAARVSPEKARQKAAKYLDEIAARHSPYAIDLVHRGIRLAYKQGYGEAVHYDKKKLEEIVSLARRFPVVFLPTHKSNLDHAMMQWLLHENGMPPSHAAGGINMNFFPIGPVFRRTGVFFIRRSFKDNPLYKFVLRQYIDFLVEKRFSLEWYIEGGRSRTGKLLPPRFGLLSYVVDAWKRGKAPDVFLIPVSISYDQISDVGDYASEAKGEKKQKESIGWFVKMLRGLRRRYGDIHIRFGEPVSVAKTLASTDVSFAGGGDDDGGKNVAVAKLAFEVCNRINHVTPITPSSLLSLALLEAGDRAMTVAEVHAEIERIRGEAAALGLPATAAQLATDADVERALAELVENGVVSRFDDCPEPLFAVAEPLVAGYYRNTIIHYFVAPSIVELALLHAADAKGDAKTAFFDEAIRLRDLLKFDFFFADKEAFRAEMRTALSAIDPGWESAFSRSPDAIRAVMRKKQTLHSHHALRAFVEAYAVVADALVKNGNEAAKEDETLAYALSLGRQYRLQQRIRSSESVSKLLFQTGYKLAGNRKLCDASPDAGARRAAFAAELRDVLRRVDAIDAMATMRRSGL